MDSQHLNEVTETAMKRFTVVTAAGWVMLTTLNVGLAVALSHSGVF